MDTQANKNSVRLLFVRHGQTEANVEHRYMGQTDSPLTPRGVEQVEAVARRLAKGRVDVIYTSDLGRAVQSTDIIARACGVSAIQDARLRERHVGLLQGELASVAREKYAYIFSDLERDGPKYSFPGGGESGLQIEERISSFLDTIAEEHMGKTVVAISHGATLCVLLWHILKFPYSSISRLRCDNACISGLSFADGKWTLEFWNDTAHLVML